LTLGGKHIAMVLRELCVGNSGAGESCMEFTGPA
jgi:hypothetical protein